jgi:serine phosphatase RsbU (regulator of sigma subunit)
VVLVVGLLITGGLSWGAHVVHRANEKRLLRQRVREVAAVVSAAIPNTQIPLASAADVVEATNANPVSFTQVMQPVIAAGRPFTSVSIWAANSARPKPLVVVGTKPELATEPAAAVRAFFARVRDASTFAIYDLLDNPERRLGYGVVATKHAKFVVYGEGELPKGRQARVASNSAFSDLDYALFVGKDEKERNLLASSTGGTKLQGTTYSESVPFGDSQLLVVLASRRDLGGELLENLWWILLLLGLTLTVSAAALVERLGHRRHEAEDLAAENADLYATQRSVALTLQHSLMLEDLPTLPHADIGARYIAGTAGLDIGGDWYDVVALDDDSLLIAVGDVSGRGLQAATMMASLRFAIRAYAAQHDGPGAILTKLTRLVSVGRDGHFATTVCAVVNLRQRTLVCANAGHPQPLLIEGPDAQYVTTTVGVPIGVRENAQYNEETHQLPARGTLLFYTDGLVERRGETLDEGFARLREAARSSDGSLTDTLSAVVAKVIPAGSADDTVLLGVRWNS